MALRLFGFARGPGALAPASRCSAAYDGKASPVGRRRGLSSPAATPAAAEPYVGPKRIVLLGCGWGGYKFMEGIEKAEGFYGKHFVTCVAPRNHFVFTPLLAGAAVGSTQIASVCTPVRPLVAKKSARFYEARALAVDKAARTVMCETLDGEPFPVEYDRLIIATGFQANDFGIQDLGKHAFFLKETGDAAALHDHLLRCFEEASNIHILDGDTSLSKKEEDRIRQVLSFVIVGAGPTGSEFAGELTDLLKTCIAREYPHLSKLWAVHLVDGAPNILGPFQDKGLQEYAAELLTARQGVQIHLNEFVDSVEDHKIRFKSGRELDFSTLVWCAGIKPLRFVQGLELAFNEKKTQLLTDGHLRVKGEEKNGIYAFGDCATIDGYPLPQTAQVAAQQGHYLARVFNRQDIENAPPFEFHYQGTMAYLGGRRGMWKTPLVVPSEKKRNFSIRGLAGGLAWSGVYWGVQLSWRNRFQILYDWASNALFGRDLTRFGMRTKLLAEADARKPKWKIARPAVGGQPVSAESRGAEQRA